MSFVDEQRCPIWQTPCGISTSPDGFNVRSLRAGGDYIISGSALAMLQNGYELENPQKVKLSRWIYEHNLLREIPDIGSGILKQVKDWNMPPVSMQMDYLLKFLESKTSVIGASVRFQEVSNEMLAATLLEKEGQLRYMIEQLQEMGLVDGESYTAPRITIAGYRRLEELRGIQASSDQAFVAMWLDDSMDKAWQEGFKPGIEEAGYKPLRIDRKEHNNKIDDEIVAEIRRSRFLIADFTSEPEKARGGVYYEAGFAKGLNIPVIFTCREDRLEDVHFDTRQFNHIVWVNPEDLRKKLADRISATVGDGPHRNKNE